MMKKFMRILFFSLLPVFMIYAGETGKLSGQVTDKATGEALVGVNVVVEGMWSGDRLIKFETPTGAATDIDGTYFILNLRPGLYDVRVIYVGFREEVRQKVRVVVDRTTRVDYAMTSETIESDAVEVTAYAPLGVEKDVTATKQSYSLDDIESIAGVSDVSDILSLQADVVGENFRGGRAGEALYLVGGSSIVNPLTRSRAFRPITTALQEIEVYTSGFSAEYGNAQSGVVNMVTREGGQAWTSRLEVSSTLPYYKTWEGSVYDPENLDYFGLLSSVDEWLKENPVDPGKPLFDVSFSFGPTYLPPRNVWPPNPLTRADSLQVARLGQLLWQQAIRDVGRDYDKSIDTRLDFSTGGPISKKATLFFATRQSTIQPVIPTPQPDLERQFVSNVVYRMNASNKFKFDFLYDNGYENDIGSQWLRWMFDQTLSVAKINTTSLQYGVSWNHVFSPSTFMDVRLKMLDLLTEQRVELLEEGEYVETYSNATNWTDYTSPSEHRIGRPEDDWGDERVSSFSADISLSSQLNRFNLLKAGLQYNYYDLNVDMNNGLSTAGNFRKVKFRNFPYEGAFYIQDKMEFSGMIANIGMRMDFYDLNTEYFTNQYAPLRDPDAVQDREIEYIFQPRVGISFPISEKSVFRLNYGTFMQRPSFNQIFFDRVDIRENIDFLGNPQLEAEKTNAYDLGVVQGITDDVRLDVSAYYKDVSNLIQDAFFEDFQQNVYQTYVNREYADIKGFHISLEKQNGFFRGYIRYNYESATANRPADLDVPVKFSETRDGDPVFQLPAPGDVFLNFDRTHKTVFNLRFRTARDNGFDLMGFRPLANLNFSTTLRLMSGRPYTFDDTGQGLQFNQRTPFEKDWKMRLEKGFIWNGQRVNFYAEAFNLLNNQVFHYSRTFDDERNTVRWNNDRENILTYNLREPYVTSQEVYLLNNQPRHYRLGMYLKF